jgi:hypothetical protein
VSEPPAPTTSTTTSTTADGLAATGLAATGLAATAAKLADDVVEEVTDMVKALLGGAADEGAASKAVKEFIERVGNLVSALLGGNGASGPAEGRAEGVANVVGDVARALGGALGGLLGGGSGIPAPETDYYHHLAAQPLAAFYQDYEQATAELIEWSAAAAGELTRAASGALSGGGVAPNQEAGGAPAAPPAPAAPAPAAPLPPVPVAPPVAPGGYSSSSVVVGSGSAGEAFQLLFAILVVFSVALLQGGRLSWLRREAHGPPSALALAIERPG